MRIEVPDSIETLLEYSKYEPLAFSPPSLLIFSVQEALEKTSREKKKRRQTITLHYVDELIK